MKSNSKAKPLKAIEKEKENALEPKVRQRPVKAYNNRDFLASSDARNIRILCEFEEPLVRFRRNKVRHTIVFFGSARIRSRETAETYLKKVEYELSDMKEQTADVHHMREVARRGVELSQYYEDAAELSERLTRWSFETLRKSHRFYVCSGGGPGIMEAANLGAHRTGYQSVGLNISLPYEQLPNPYQSEELSFEFHYFFMRKFWFVYLAKALVVFPGGFGTMDEMFELLTLVQTQKTKKYMPIILYGSKFWREIVNFQALVKWGVVSPDDMNLFQFVDTVDEAYPYLTKELTRLYLVEKHIE
ncbi:MAG: TIGR00730 family Rossman fold protein [Candidatus Hydrogenedentales bacterium]